MSEMSRQKRLNPEGTDYKGRTSEHKRLILHTATYHTLAKNLTLQIRYLELAKPEPRGLQVPAGALGSIKKLVDDACHQLGID